MGTIVFSIIGIVVFIGNIFCIVGTGIYISTFLRIAIGFIFTGIIDGGSRIIAIFIVLVGNFINIFSDFIVIFISGVRDSFVSDIRACFIIVIVFVVIVIVGNRIRVGSSATDKSNVRA